MNIRNFICLLPMLLLATSLSAQSDTTVVVVPEQWQAAISDTIFIDLVYVPQSSFMMGATAEQGSDAAADELPLHEVTLSPFYIATTECTQALWEAVMGYNVSDAKGSNLPVTNVNVYECREFLRALSKKTGCTFRLPTEAEWEYAARGGAKGNATKYSGSDTLSVVAWSAADGMNPHDVAGKAPNELGLYDLSGNVYEICEDEYVAYKPEAQTDPKGRTSDRQVFRGGGYISSPVDCRTTARSCAPTDYRDAFIGFRIVMQP